MFRPVLQDLTRLAVFAGREGRPQFWSYAVFAFTLYLVIGMSLAMPMMLGAMQRMHAFALANPEQSKVVVGPGRYSVQIEGRHPELLPDLDAFFAISFGAFAVLAAFLAAAMVRRLHDAGRTGAWALLPLPFVPVAFALFPRLMESFEGAPPNPGFILLLFANNVLYLGAVGLLIVLLAGRPTPGSNRFGPPPEG